MKFCPDHWAALKAAIDARGMGDLVAPDAETAHAQMVSSLKEGVTTPVNFDPLMSAHWAIVSNVMTVTGLAVLYAGEDGEERCPLCFMAEGHKAHCQDPTCTIENYDNWIERAADDSLAAWQEILAHKT